MTGKNEEAKNENDSETESQHRPRPFWSGSIVFGLVNLPVSLFPANRGKAISLIMVDEQGNRLRQRYFCEKEERILERDEIVRGYPVDSKRYVIVEDEELEALAPDKTREIDLRQFVSLDEINPVFFERGYFLAPDSRATKAYRLLAKCLEEEQRAGIATFVMRDREYLVAIMSERGILRAETLRFHDEIRSPQQVGLPDTTESPDRKLEQKMRRAIKARSKEKLDPELLVEQEVQHLRELVNGKLEKHEDVLEDEQTFDSTSDQEDDNVIDLIQVLKERLRGQTGSEPGQLNRDELYAEAQKKGIPGRSKMNKDQLASALEKAG